MGMDWTGVYVMRAGGVVYTGDGYIYWLRYCVIDGGVCDDDGDV